MYLQQPNNPKPEMFKNVHNFLSQSECLMIKTIADTTEKWEGKVHGNDKEATKVNDVRKVDVYPFQDLALAEMIFETVKIYNDDYFRFDIAGIFDNLQLLHYKEGCHYDWHTDATARDSGTPRKLSMAMLLSDPADFEGGEFQARVYSDEILTLETKRGRAWFFPSYTMHRITPVTKGVRRSLVLWVGGPPFK